MKSIVKLSVVVLCVVSIFLTVNIALSAGEKKEEEIVLKFWSMQQSDRRVQDNQNSVIQAFQEMNPNVKVELEVTPYAGYRDKVLVAAKGKSTRYLRGRSDLELRVRSRRAHYNT